MDSAGHLRKGRILSLLVMVFNMVVSHEHSSRNPENRRTGDEFSHVDKLPSWYNTSVGAKQKHGTVSSLSSRWRTQMAFSKTVYSFQVKEDTVPGTVVGKVEAQLSNPTPITFSVQEDDGENMFLLSPVSGEFLLSRSLDFETQRFYILTVEVQEGGSQVSSVRVYFNVLDVNDNPPVFSQSNFFASVLEDARVATCFLLLNVSDKDDGENGEVELKVVSGDDLAMFFVHSTGSLCLNKELDREGQSSYNLTVTVNDCSQPASSQFTSTAHVLVEVEDINDNAPIFVSAKHVSIPEDSALHSVVMAVHAKDKDTGSNGEVLYFLSNDSWGRFSIDNTSGEVFLQKILDREKEDSLNITVTAKDMGSPQMATTVKITVQVEDVNDNDPVFFQSNYSLFVKEDVQRGTILLQVTAEDQDIASNGRVRYMLTPAGAFVIDTVRGILSVIDRLDRERNSNYTLFLTATDQGDVPRSATTAVSITVLDVNDFTPLFSPEIMTIHVKENEEDPSELTHEVSALDEDLGINSQLNYFIHQNNGDGLFSVTPSGVFKILQSLDKEKETYYIVIITAVDSGIPALTGTLTIHVIVNDVNDNHPEFSEEVYNTLVSEDSPIGTVFAILSAFDADEGPSGEVRYFMESHDAPFTIEETSGELFTTDFLDRETVAFYTLTVIGTDMHPTQSLSSTVLVTVLVGDINDHWPQFLDSPFVAHVPTELPPGSVVCAVRATDEDTDMNAELHYSLYGQSSDLFSIDQKTGTVFTSSSLESMEDIIINVYVEDAGENPKFDITTISIRFQNVSDFPKMNVDILSYFLFEDEPVGTVVAVFSAASIRAEPVSFYLASGNFEDMFQIDQLGGALTVENSLDYESKKEFSLLIEARDSGSPPFSSFLEIHINITDVNDNFPQFTQAEYRCEVYENSPPSGVCDVLAIDADSHNYSKLWYNITGGNNDEFFTVDPESGLVSTAVSLDRESTPVFNLTLEAVESDNPLHAAQATVIISVLDRNDNAPRFSQIYLAEVFENVPIGYTVLQITSTDDDDDFNAVINYYIQDQDQYFPFDIDSTNGWIIVQRSLDREVQDHYVLKVNANDSAWSVTTDVSIFVLDFNDNRPIFSADVYSIVISEAKYPEIFVLQVFATDTDIGINSEIVYIVEPPNELFWVNTSSGEVFSKQPLLLRNSAFEIYTFTIVAFDCGIFSLQSNTSVTVRLEQFNHNPPMFLPSPALVAIPYDLPVGTQVAEFTAIDLDSNSGYIEYNISGGNASDFFWIQTDNGKVLLNQTLETCENKLLTLLLVAKDQGFPPLISQTKITFEITGENQFSPRFSDPHVMFSVPEDLPIGSVTGKVQAEDEDYGPNGDITYCIGPDSQYFPVSIGEVSGLLTLNRELDFEKERIYNMQVKATDGGWISKSAWLNVTVIVTDVNDNPPVFSLSEYTSSVPENSKVKTSVLDVKATDMDSGVNAQILYSLIAGSLDKFEIDPRNGSITTLDVFDYEQQQMFDLTIKASNTARHTLFSLAYVVIHILDLNEFSPTFMKESFSFSVFKNVPVGTSIGKVTATDNDSGPEGDVFYLMFGHSKNVGFDIGTLSGEIYTCGSLGDLGNSNVILKVLAKNPGVITGTNIAEALVNIKVIETNNAPMFTSTCYEASVTEDSPTGTSVLTVSALDLDSVLMNRFNFKIVDGNTNSSFSIDPFSGIVFINSPLDRELWPVYNLTVTATDNGSPPATGTTNIIVSIVDINDNAPKLLTTKVKVKENQPEGTIVARLNAFDFDLPPNQGPFTFWLSNLSADSAFFLTSDGILLTTRVVDREHVSEYRLLVVVKDAGFPHPLSSTATLHIKVDDENDNPPLPRNIFIEVKYFGSSFNGGMIGNVHPEDNDESDVFLCSIKSGPIHMFRIPNGTCELWSSSFQGEATFNVTVEATDQVHFPVNNSIYVNYKGFTNASVNSCVLFYVSSSSMERFLSNKYLRFVKALDSLFNLQASKTHVFGIKHVGRETLLLAAVKNYNGQYLSREIASSISAGHKKLLESQSNVTISHITSDPCVVSPCQNGASCNKNIYISQDVTVLESMAVIFVSPQKEIFNCTCLVGFSGPLCEDDIDECEVNPCENNSTCENTAGSFHCHCQNGFSGSFCSADVDECLKVKCQNGGTCIQSQEGSRCQCVPGFEGERCEQTKDHCRSTPCFQGHCINLQTGFLCNCPFGVSGVHCEEPSFGFEEMSFVEFPPLDRRTNLIYFEFATVQKDSLLLYNPGTLSSKEFFALEIIDGTIQLSYDLGSGPIKLKTYKHIADGHFHSITVSRIGNMGFLLVDNCTEVENNGFCFSESDGIISERTLDVGNTNMTFGGLRSLELILQHPSQIKTHDFVGCIRNLHVNGFLLRPSLGLATYNVFSRCLRAAVSGCNNYPCKNGGLCHDLWSDYVCECKTPFTGRNCDTEISEELVLSLKRGDYIEYVIKEKFKRDLLLKDLMNDAKQENTTDHTLINIKFKTKEEGPLLFILGKRGNIMLMIRDRKPVYASIDTTSGHMSEFTADLSVADGLWHIMSLRAGRNTYLSVDDKMVLNITKQNLDFRLLSLEKIILGAAPQRLTNLKQSGFIGCVEYLNVSGRSLPVSGPNLMVEVWPSSTLPQSSCSSQGVCLFSPCSEENTWMRACLSDCQHQRTCQLATHGRSCICLQNVSFCDICFSNTECSVIEHKRPLWVIAVVLPLITIIVVCMFVVLYRLRQRNSTFKNENIPHKTGQGTENTTFGFDDNHMLRAPHTLSKGKVNDQMCAFQQRPNEMFGSEAFPSSAQWKFPSELEYFEIGSNCSAVNSDSNSSKFTCHKHLCNTEHLKKDSNQWGDLKLLLGKYTKNTADEQTHPPNPQNVDTLHKLYTEQQQKKTPCSTKEFPHPESLEATQPLSFDEISKLNVPLEPAFSHQALLQSGPIESMMTTETSSEYETDSTFTCSGSEYDRFSKVSDKKQRHEQPFPSECMIRKDVSLPGMSFIELTSSSPLDQDISKSDHFATFEQWKQNVDVPLTFDSYAAVFGDVASIPMELSHGCDLQSDEEEII